ncbi:hypothetical protein BDV29DRAFT_184074 [Aspergillus leporis]|uniref:Uncharacterized protein n=1 Tax=Aspergillus leporis TaxID=41062 RepID=A0A5N5WNC1_9EURO|nr:hypothetical protein BDV29DRAFT_184074 [Aspergillus leporis]
MCLPIHSDLLSIFLSRFLFPVLAPWSHGIVYFTLPFATRYTYYAYLHSTITVCIPGTAKALPPQHDVENFLPSFATWR